MKHVLTTRTQEGLEKLKAFLDSARGAEWPIWYEDIPVRQELYDYMVAIKKAMPNVSFAHSLAHPSWTGTASICSRVFVKLPDQPYMVGWVAYGDFNVGSSLSNVYIVHSRKIQNDKYHHGRDQHNMVMSSNIDKAVRNCKKYLIPYANIEVAKVTYEKVQGSITKIANSGLTLAREMLNQCGMGSYNTQTNEKALLEMKHLKDSGVKFKTNFFAPILNQVDEVYAKYMEIKQYVPQVVFARITDVETSPMVHLIWEDKKAADTAYFGTDSVHIATYPISEVPEDIGSRLAVLNILERGQYVERVGYRHSDNVFWIEREMV